MKRLTIIIAIILSLGSCKKDDPPELVETTVGENFNIELEANWSTGYRWEWTNRDNIEIVDTTDLSYVQVSPHLEGSPGTEIWSFLAKSTGDETLNFIYQRTGSSGDKNDPTKSFRVIVK